MTTDAQAVPRRAGRGVAGCGSGRRLWAPAILFRVVLPIVVLGMLSTGCGSDQEQNAAQNDQGIFADMGDPLPSASAEQLAAFERGRQVAMHRFTPAEGLGPDFNVTACTACHEKPVIGGSAGRYRNFLLVRSVQSDGSSISVGVNGVQPEYTLKPGGRRPTDPGTNLIATRNPIPFFGVGLLAEIPDSEILKRVDENDANGDGISGRANFDRGFVGRFGRKAQTVSIEGFIRGPLFNHLGITTDPLPDDLKAKLPVPSAAPPSNALADLLFVNEADAQVAAPDTPTTDNDGVPDPEMSDQDLFDLVSFSMLLAAPRPDPPTPTTEAGSQLFEQIGCTGCHVRALEGPRGPVPAYSDLLLHDMGPGLADDMTFGVASGSEFRTQPLWGIGAEAPYLHDGRADTLDEAIRMHGGEAQASRDNYVSLTSAEQDEVIAFLDSLGGSKQKSAGLLPPNAPILPVGTLGGPDRPLSTSEKQLFLRGRQLFDRDVPLSEGLGPNFNGDSCRACHFIPVIGGAGPADVDVIRQGLLFDGVFTAPEGGTILSRESTSLDSRTEPDPISNTFETRQTPPLFGLGFLESIPEEEILAHADCSNPDPNAIAGCPHILPDGRLGRFGWKANVPSLEEFARDGLSNEIGVTVPPVAGFTFGKLTDADNVPDPEIAESNIEALAFYMKHLAPPPGQSTDPEAEARGKSLFNQVGCNSCHREDFVTPQGVVAYTDLLLHQVAPDGSPGIEDGTAGPLEIRTPPLWGISLTPPYMHDGRSFSIDDAIDRHDAEGARSREAYEALTDAEKADLLAFLGSL